MKWCIYILFLNDAMPTFSSICQCNSKLLLYLNQKCKVLSNFIYSYRLHIILFKLFCVYNAEELLIWINVSTYNFLRFRSGRENRTPKIGRPNICQKRHLLVVKCIAKIKNDPFTLLGRRQRMCFKWQTTAPEIPANEVDKLPFETKVR